MYVLSLDVALSVVERIRALIDEKRDDFGEM
jgi:hypothetical protein